MKCPSCSFEFTVKGRTIQQNKAYWPTIVVPLAEHLGYTNDECHELLKDECNSVIEFLKQRDGSIREVRRTKSTTSLTTTEFNEYMSKCRILASQLGCYLFEPNEKR